MSKLTDHIGIVGACACLIHCLLLPVLAVRIHIETDIEWFHQAMIVLTAIVSGHALWHGYKVHCRHIVFVYGGVGLGILITALFASEAIEAAATSFGALLIITAHVLNIRLRRACCVNTDDKCCNGSS
jgi:hypothetical protein